MARFAIWATFLFPVSCCGAEVSASVSVLSVIPSWLNVDSKKKSVKIAVAPTRNDASSQIEEQLIVELYSK